MASPTPSDEDGDEVDRILMGRVADGDRDAFATLYDRCAAVSYTTALRMLQSDAAAQHLVSDVFCEIWQFPRRYHPDRGRVRTYIGLLTRSRALDLIRSDKGRKNRESTFEQQRQTSGRDSANEDPARRAMIDEESRRVRAAMQALSSTQRAALELVYFEGCTHQQVADRLETPLGSAKTHIRQGLIALRKSLSATGLKERNPEGI